MIPVSGDVGDNKKQQVQRPWLGAGKMLNLKEPVETRDQHGASKVAVMGDETGVTGGRGHPGLITSMME